jgi:hypothetical protein
MKTKIKQNKYLFFHLLLLIVLQSCSTYKHTFETDSGTEVKKIKLFNVWVFKTDQSKIKGLLYSADLDGITLAKDKKFNKADFVTISVSEIAKIKFNRKGQLGYSTLAGAMIGTAMGAMIGYSRGDDENSIIFTMTKEDKAAVNGVIFGVIGGGVGLLMGTAKKKIVIDGNQKIYDSNLGTIQSYSVVWKY